MTNESLNTVDNARFVCLAYFWVEFVIASVLMLKQLYHIRNRKWGPAELTKYPEYTEGIYHLSATLMRDSLWQDIKIKLFTTVIWTVTISSDLVPFMWDSLQLADSEFDFTPNFMPLEMRQDISFGFWFGLFELLVLDFPKNFFQRQLLRSYGFHNKSTLYSVRQQFSETVVNTMNRTLTCFCISFFIGVYDEHTTEHHTLLRHCLLAVVYSMSLLALDVFLLHIFFLDKRFIPIPTGPLREQVEIICDKFDYPLENVYIEVVPEETPMNAYCYSFFGLFSRIVVLSSMIEGFYDPPDSRSKHKSPGLNLAELEGIFAHEMGHWVENHNEKRTAALNILAEPLIFTCAVWLKDQKFLFEVFRFSSTDTEMIPYPLLPGLFLAEQVLLRPCTEIINALWNPFNSAMESEADVFAVPLGHGEGLKSGLVRMEVLLTGFPTSDPVYALFYNHHPTVIERVQAIDRAMAQ